ncbi:DUF4136 domain-containing protein [Stutzerimonas sp. VN223-3]|uniref:DUF4136 domain-containing protein n=1 Tax=Stutzerimonas sp. VN223-3 TaxID=3384601 RepID=UPI0038B496A7
MFTRAALPLLCLSLVACQSNNPYTSESAPIPPAPPVEQIQSPVYPAAPRDFSSYQSWSWRNPPPGTASLAGEELQEMVAGALDQRGLRPAPENTKGDVQISARANMETRVRQTYDDYGPHIGAGHYGGYGSGYGIGTSAPIMRTYEEEVVSVYVEMYDSSSGQAIWSNRAEARSGSNQAERKDAARQAVNNALADYPPR